MIQAPLPHIAMHIEQAKSIGQLGSHQVRILFTSLPGIGGEPGILREVAFRVAKVIAARSSCPACILPFCLGRQAIGFAFSGAKPFAEFLSIVPTHVRCRACCILLNEFFPCPGRSAHDLPPLALSYLGFADVKCMSKNYRDLSLCWSLPCLLWGRSHLKCAWTNERKLHPDGIGE